MAATASGHDAVVRSDPAPALDPRMLPLLAELSQQLALSLDLEETLHQAVTRIAGFMQCEAAAVFLLEDDWLVCRASSGPVDVRGLKIPSNRGIVGRAVTQNACQLVRDAQLDPDFTGIVDAATGFRTRSVLSAPLSTAAGPIGALQVLNKRDGGLFDDSDRDALRLLAAPTALALSGARMAEKLLEQTRIRRELTMARRLQRSLLPRRRRAGYPVRALNLPAREISGDFYDFFDLPDGRIAFTLGDVAGKGLDAAFLMVRCASLLRWAGKEGLPPGEWLARVNDELGEAIAPGMFVCAVAGYYDPLQATATWANAGFPPLLRADRDGGVELFAAEGPPLGILPGMTFPEQHSSLEGAALYLYSDGVTDVRDARGDTLGVEGVRDIVAGMATLAPEPRLRAMVRELRQLTITDDTTLMLVEGPSADVERLLVLSFPARPEELAGVRHRVAEALQRAGVAEELCQQLVLAVDEAATNIIRHGYGGPCSASIELRVSLQDGELRFGLRDSAPCVDPARVQARDLAECRPGGLGVAFIDALMDAWSLAPAEEGRGNLLVMRKRIAASAQDEDMQGEDNP